VAPPSAGGRDGTSQLTNTGQWKDVRFELTGHRVHQNSLGDADVRDIRHGGHLPTVTIDELRISTAGASPYG